MIRCAQLNCMHFAQLARPWNFDRLGVGKWSSSERLVAERDLACGLPRTATYVTLVGADALPCVICVAVARRAPRPAQRALPPLHRQHSARSAWLPGKRHARTSCTLLDPALLRSYSITLTRRAPAPRPFCRAAVGRKSQAQLLERPTWRGFVQAQARDRGWIGRPQAVHRAIGRRAKRGRRGQGQVRRFLPAF